MHDIFFEDQFGWFDPNSDHHQLARYNAKKFGEFPYLKQRRFWNADWPWLHTTTRVIEWIVADESQKKGINATCAPWVAKRMDEMGFPVPDVRRTIAAIMTSHPHIVEIDRRHYPDDGGKSWKMYVWTEAAAEDLRKRDGVLAPWADEPMNIQRINDILMTIEKLGLSRFFPPKPGFNDGIV